MLYFKPATLFTPYQNLPGSALLVEEGRITALGPTHDLPPPARAQVIEAEGLALAPGFIDLQCNGGFGLDLTEDPSCLWEVAARLPQYGVTSFLPTLVSCPLETFEHALAVWRGGPPSGRRGALPLGWHLEGPFLSPEKKGAHNPAHLRAVDLRLMRDWSPENGVRLVTLAPELPGALEAVRELRERGVVVSAGHSTATWEEAQAGFGTGIRYGTHLFNAMPPLNQRSPGLAGALLADPEITVGIIADGIHVHPAVVALAWRLKGPRLNLVTDAISALSMPPGRYPLAGGEIIVDGSSARLADGTLAGSLLSMDAAVRNLAEFTGCSLSEAAAAASSTPAEVLGLPAKGRLKAGCEADLVLLTPQGEVAATFVAGREVYRRAGWA